MPQEAGYRKYTEEVVAQRLKIVLSVSFWIFSNSMNHEAFCLQTPVVKDLEKSINCGQAEELIVQAENELILARKMLGWKPWEPLAKQAPAKQWDWPPAKIEQPKLE